MSPDVRAALRTAAEAGITLLLPPDVVLELLAGQGGAVQTSATPTADLTVADLCTRFKRKPSAVRAWLERGDFPGAYKLKRRDWRVPAAGVEAFLAKQTTGERAPTAGDLSAWRRMRGRE